MRAYAIQDDRVFRSYGQATWLRVLVQAADLSWQDLTALFGWDFVSGVDITEDPDNGCATAKLAVSREVFRNALSTEVAGSRLNRLGGGTRLLELNARVQVYSQLRPTGAPPDPAKWSMIFDGCIDSTDSGPDPMSVDLSDLSGRLQRAWIEAEVSYGVWAASRRVLANTVVVLPTDNPAAPTGYLQAQNTGTTGTTQPAMPAVGSTVADGGVTWKNLGTSPTGTPIETHIQQLLDDNLGAGAWALYCPAPSGTVIRPYLQQQDSLLTALQDVADIAGWNVRYRWSDSNPGGAGFYLTLYDPGRGNATPFYSIPADCYDPIGQFARDIQTIRNAVAVSYYDVQDLDSSGNPKPKTVVVTDPASIAAYGRLYMAVAEPAGAGIGTAAQANAMANAILSDLSQPPISGQVGIGHAWWLQPSDVVLVEADGLHSDSDLTCAVYSIEHQIQQGARATTLLNVRARPSSGLTKWLTKQAAGGMNGGSLATATPPVPVAPVATPTIRGAAIDFQVPSW